MVYHARMKKCILLYFLNDGRVYRVKEEDIKLKLWEELEHVLYLLKVKNKFTHDAAGGYKECHVEAKGNGWR